jgi:hypothetical protein
MNARQKHDANERRQELFEAADWKCLHCRGYLREHGTPQLAHRIAKTKGNIVRWGLDVINHPYNLAPVCQVEPCNSAMNLGMQPMSAHTLAHRIHDQLAQGFDLRMEDFYRELAEQHGTGKAP